MDVVMAGRLEEACPDPICDRVIIRNISGHGARVLSERPWKARQLVRLAEPGGEQHIAAVVVYCKSLDDKQFAVGLKFDLTAQSDH